MENNPGLCIEFLLHYVMHEKLFSEFKVGQQPTTNQQSAIPHSIEILTEQQVFPHIAGIST